MLAVYILLYDGIMFSYIVSSPRVFFINDGGPLCLKATGIAIIYYIYIYMFIHLRIIIILYTRGPVKRYIWVRHPLGPNAPRHHSTPNSFKLRLFQSNYMHPIWIMIMTMMKKMGISVGI